MTKDAHYFIGIPVREDIQQWLAEWQNMLQEKGQLAYKSWTHPSDLHITLTFLGAVSENKITAIIEELEKLEDLFAFHLNIGTMGTFGKGSQPRVLWAGVEVNEVLTELQDKVASSCSMFGFSKESRPYHPHVTLAKKWDNSFNKELVLPEEAEFSTKREMMVDHLAVYKIHPSKSPKYEIVTAIRLN
ncbi:RNA 2',3'-cyclic phosphodiesterase [Radiobacillus kanasensis]|uniref:RNA 2',3'-cyclic phosphodiesterase n=1 Tax=Radiobacillus kanasensis TaxID=2844358 RepID=UPI001E63C234|nr:RNA 2',3'-cyclic phosphodiesterase [Radiobacillus kanasensis]UFT98154.1 RNA 2',3'-cyclic phosphodiesterase [Radiobacillus kanasensis]